MTDHPLNQVVEVPLDAVKPDPKNPRRVKPRRFAALVRSIQADPDFLHARPIIALPDGLIVAGEQRWRAAAEAKRETVWVYFAKLNAEQRRTWALRDNNHAGEFVPDLLAEFMDGMPKSAIELTGFTPDDVARVLKPAKAAPPPAADDLPDAPARPVTRPGDVITLGDHRLMCGDSTKDADLRKLLGGKRVDAIFTDPPYAIYGSSTGLSSEVADDKMVRSFFRDILVAAHTAVKPFGHVYVCCDWRSWSSWWEVAKGTGLNPKNMIVWDKGGAGLGNNYANTHELLLFAASIPPRQRMTQENAGQRAVLDSNLWRIPRVPAGEDRVHNAQKPVELVERAVGNSTDDGARVLDLFGGSGTTLIACERLGRAGLAMEIDPKWCDVAVARWEKVTGKRAKRPRRR